MGLLSAFHEDPTDGAFYINLVPIEPLYLYTVASRRHFRTLTVHGL